MFVEPSGKQGLVYRAPRVRQSDDPESALLAFERSSYVVVGHGCRRGLRSSVYGEQLPRNIGDLGRTSSIHIAARRLRKDGPAMWDKRDWHQFFQLAQRPWQRRRPPRPVAPSGVNRVLPVVGFSLSELDDAGINLELAERLGLPVDAARVGVYGPNVSALRDFVRSARQPG